MISSTLEGTLSKALQKYYTRKGNKILFANGMTLNQLAWEMWERLGYEGIDPSVVSRVIKGERLFTLKQLEVFGQILKIASPEKEKLKTSLLYKLGQRFGIENDLFINGDKYLIDLLKVSLLKIRELKKLDLPFLTDDWMDSIIEHLKSKIATPFGISRRKMLLSLYAEFLIEKIYSLQVTHPTRDSLSPIVKLSEEIEKVGEELKNPVYVSLANVNKGDIFYINHLFNKAIFYLTRGIEDYNKDAQKIFHWTPLRPLALSHAYLGHGREFDTLKNRILGGLPTLGMESQCLALEGISKGEAMLGRAKDAEKYLVQSLDTQGRIKQYNGPYENLLKVLLTGSELESSRKLRIKRNPGYFEKLGKQGIELAEKYGYKRHELKIRNLLSDMLN